MFRRLIALAAGATCLLSGAAQAQERDLKFVLDFISLGRHAPWYVALGKGHVTAEEGERMWRYASALGLSPDVFRALTARWLP